MSLQFFGLDKIKKTGREYNKPSEILNDPYLTSLQKYMVLEAMLSSVNDEEETSGTRFSQRLVDEITRAKLLLKTQMD
ncbi:MAG: hypothetical protein DI586_10985 [Micavibrio aeruginosavorus]|uniref:Uncharacterized protein n=1 Tax=Micavibrio aeruginosavorus TaxID=349221 RepID=A0A2W5FBL6_9BACT|nr:MAG: hypothetical protein DI586_10985 [Micavibrio aeruginosavorus]